LRRKPLGTGLVEVRLGVILAGHFPTAGITSRQAESQRMAQPGAVRSLLRPIDIGLTDAEPGYAANPAALRFRLNVRVGARFSYADMVAGLSARWTQTDPTVLPSWPFHSAGGVGACRSAGMENLTASRLFRVTPR